MEKLGRLKLLGFVSLYILYIYHCTHTFIYDPQLFLGVIFAKSFAIFFAFCRFYCISASASVHQHQCISIIFDILEQSSFQKYTTCSVFLALRHMLYLCILYFYFVFVRLEHGNIIFDILEKSSFKKYTTCWVSSNK